MKLQYIGRLLKDSDMIANPRIWNLIDANSPYNGSSLSLNTLTELGYVKGRHA